MNLANHDVVTTRIFTFRAACIMTLSTISMLNRETEVVGQLRSMAVIAFSRKVNLYSTVVFDGYSLRRKTRNVIAIEGIVIDAINHFINVNERPVCIAKDSSVGLIVARVLDEKSKILNNHIIPELLNALEGIVVGKVGFNRRNVGADCVRHGF